MAQELDDTDFVDRDYLAARQGAGIRGSNAQRPPSREELDQRVGDTHQKLAELRRAQEALERERAALEEARRRRTELATGREELLHHLTRGIGLLEEGQLKAQREAAEMTRTLEGFRDALAKVESIQEEAWTQDNWNAELTRGLTILENARMEWNGARLRWTVLDGVAEESDGTDPAGSLGTGTSLDRLSFLEIARIGAAFTLPFLVLAVLAFVVWLFYLFGK